MLRIFAAVVALSDPTGPVIEARIADVIASPEQYGGRTLRIRGQLDACHGYVCSICPEEMTPETKDAEKCLRLSFDGFMSDEDRVGPATAAYTPVVGPEMEEAFRFSILTAEGEFNPSCLTHRPWPPQPPVVSQTGEPMLDEIVCTDRASTWRGVQVRVVHRRLPSNAGLVFGRDGGRLTPAPDAVSEPVTAAYHAYLESFGDEQDDPLAVFLPEFPLFSDEDEPARDEARLCICLKDSCEGEWPRGEISVRAPTVNDPYVCHVALKVAHVWRVYPE